MSAEGYKQGGRADVGWWIAQINAGVDFRKKYAREAHWPRWRRYYRGDWKTGVLPVNMFFSMLRALVPRVYFRNPSVSVTPGKPGFLEMAFAQVVNRVDNKMLRQMHMKREMKRCVQDAFLCGTAAIKLGFGAQYSPAGGDEDAPQGNRGERLEYHPNVLPSMPFGLRVPTGHLIVPDQVESLEGARWVAHWTRRPREDVVRDKRLDKAARESIGPSHHVKVGTESIARTIEMVDLVEIRDAKYRQVIVINPYGQEDNRPLLQSADALQERGRFPIFPIIFNPDDEFFWGIPDAQILEPQQLELNEVRTQQMKHRRLSIIKILMRHDFMDSAEIDKLLSEDVGAVAKVNQPINPQAIQKFETANIPTDLIVQDREIMQDIREQMGFSRNQLGEFQSRRGDTSATEAAIVEAASELRVDERRDVLADVLQEFVTEMNELLFTRWGPEQVVDVVGPGGAQVWVRFDPGVLRLGTYDVRVDPDSAAPRTRKQREQKAATVYELLKANPLVDPLKLTQYLLNEIEGVEMDDLIRALPSPQNPPIGPIGMPEYAGLLARQVGRAGGASQPGRR